MIDTNWTSRASHQWASRPDDQRFTSLQELLDYRRKMQDESSAKIVPSRRVLMLPDEDHKGLRVTSPAAEEPYVPTHWAFGQICQLAESPAGYLRTLPAEIAADCINFKNQFSRNVEDVGLLLRRNEERELRCATGPRYGRIWDTDVIQALMTHLPPSWKVPGIFGKALDEVTKENTTLYASDRDMFVFLTDEEFRVNVPNRRNGESGQLARGIFAWNSEVGSRTFGFAKFYLDHVCENRMIWGGEGYEQITIRHTASAPDQYIEQILPALTAYQNSSTKPIEELIKAAQQKRVDDKLEEFLGSRFGKRAVGAIQQVHVLEEDRPIETLWDANVAVTAWARGIKHQDARVDVERKAGEMLQLAA